GRSGRFGGGGGRGPRRFPFGEDHWSVFAAERREIADFIKDHHISGVCILHGDSHMLAADDGTHSDYATGGGAPLPVMCAAPLDQEPSIKGGRIDVSYSGRNNKNEERISLKFTVPASKESATSGKAGGLK